MTPEQQASWVVCDLAQANLHASTAEEIDAMVAKLEAAGAVWFIGDEVVYGRK